MAKISEWIGSINTSYPDPASWKILSPLTKIDVFRFVRLWLCEGIPFAFKNQPGVYELAREAFVEQLSEHSNHLSITGSGRLGFSLSPQKFGKNYSIEESDYDLFLVSSVWFEKLREDAELFVRRFESGDAQPQNRNEQRYWKCNSKLIPKNLQKGFVNQHFIPNFDRYKYVRNCYQACEKFGTIVHNEHGIKKVPKVSVRVYKNWEAAELQIGNSLLTALKQTGHKIVKH